MSDVDVREGERGRTCLHAGHGSTTGGGPDPADHCITRRSVRNTWKLVCRRPQQPSAAAPRGADPDDGSPFDGTIGDLQPIRFEKQGAGPHAVSVNKNESNFARPCSARGAGPGHFFKGTRSHDYVAHGRMDRAGENPGRQRHPRGRGALPADGFRGDAAAVLHQGSPLRGAKGAWPGLHRLLTGIGQPAGVAGENDLFTGPPRQREKGHIR